VIDGPLWLVGGGDPLLGTPGWRPSEHEWTESVEPVTSLDDLAGAVRSAGVTRVTGGIVGDDSRFEDLRALPTWDSSYLADGEIGPVGALVVDGGFPNRPDRLTADPATEAAGSFLSLLSSHGVQIEDGASHGYAPPGAVQIASIPSAPLSVIVGEMLRESDNLAAEMLLKDMGYAVGAGGTWAASAPLVRAALVAAGIPVAGLVQSDGSGLDRGDRVTCTTLDAVVAHGGPVSAVIDAGLPQAGVCGTLVGRFLNQPGADRVWAKTGTLAGVDALTGTVTAPVATTCPPGGGPPAGPVTFSLIVNHTSSDAAGQAIEDRVGDALSEYPPPVDLTALGLGSP
jgi:D-alanyl-D-alanine carboxypeptidase/D-alanyl-D-alanine-endopeptidase (penicillin-binding protein 4)